MATLHDIGNAYRAADHAPTALRTVRAYAALRRDVLAQFRGILADGISVTFTARDPYATSEDLCFDVLARGTLRVWRGADVRPSHPLAERTEYGVTLNCLFRAVHDYRGHVLGELSFRPADELRAAQVHAAQFSREALPALATETLGQLCAQFFASGSDGTFPEQKAFAMPSHLWGAIL